ncbi:hypothetical protein LAZ67_7002334 [Cordylochernes scorpioides]|uniref:Uncharacterized protein n=1 Tax=Cordylochernes scorpioides TaxID=51811 RepID=A0ABY6KNM6_9ARAC|nr:hypothetical protein LAZ67_7002334 [Cordylochernes scorpioides]
MAEAGVKIAKLILKKNQDPSLGLLEYRSTPLENGYSPAELLMGRKLRTTLPIAPENLNPKTYDGEVYWAPDNQPTPSWMMNYSPYYLLPTYNGEVYWALENQPTPSWMRNYSSYYLLPTYDGEVYWAPENQPTPSWMRNYSSYYLLPYTDMVMVFRKMTDDAPKTKEEDAQVEEVDYFTLICRISQQFVSRMALTLFKLMEPPQESSDEED